MFYIERVEKGSVVLRFLISVWFPFFFLVVFAYSVLMMGSQWNLELLNLISITIGGEVVIVMDRDP